MQLHFVWWEAHAEHLARWRHPTGARSFPGIPVFALYLHFPFISPLSVALFRVFQLPTPTMWPTCLHCNVVTTRSEVEESWQNISDGVDRLSPPAGHIVVVQHCSFLFIPAFKLIICATFDRNYSLQWDTYIYRYLHLLNTPNLVNVKFERFAWNAWLNDPIKIECIKMPLFILLFMLT